jgi:hypothetical protein
LPRRDAIDEIREDLARLRAEVSELKEKFEHLPKKRRWWRNPSHIVNVVTLLALIVGAAFQIWINRPVVDFQLAPSTPSLMTDYYSVSQEDPFTPQPHLFYFEAQNTGKTDISLEITVAAINATVSTSETGRFNVTAIGFEFIQAGSGYSTWSFYVKANKGVTSFRVYLQDHQLVASPDWLTTMVDGFATYNSINAQQLTWVTEARAAYTVIYVLQT